MRQDIGRSAWTDEVQNEIAFLSLWVLPNAESPGVVRHCESNQRHRLVDLSDALAEDGPRAGRRRAALDMSLGSGPLSSSGLPTG